MKIWFAKMFAFMKPAKAKEQLTEDFLIKKYFKSHQERVFWIAIISYILYYFIRRQWSVAGSDLINNGLMTKDIYSLVGMAMGLSYGVSKFVMGSVGDRSNARWFLGIGLILSSLMNFVMGWTVGINITNIVLMMSSMALIGWFQGMGWPASARSMTNWFIPKEKQMRMTFWNTSHNFGTAIIAIIIIISHSLLEEYIGIASYFILPSAIALVGGILICIFMKDRPESLGLLSVEEHYKKYYPEKLDIEVKKFVSANGNKNKLVEKTWFYYFKKYVLLNKNLWIIAFANLFIYVLRNGVSDWTLTFFKEQHNFDVKNQGKWLWSIFEWMAVPGTILMGFTAKTLFKGRLTPIMIAAIAITTLSIVGLWQAQYQSIWQIALFMGIAGFCIYGPVAFIGMQAMDLSNKRVVATAAGFTGIFGYFGDAVISKVVIGSGLQSLSNRWDATFIFLIVCGVSACILLSLVWNKSYHDNENE